MERWTRSPSAWLSTFTPGTSFSASSAAIDFDVVFWIVSASMTDVAAGFSRRGISIRGAVTITSVFAAGATG